MSQQLINTSAPKGLKPGSQGFCTVAMTAGLSDAWAARLESLSGYRPIYPLGDAKSQNNPVNFCHWRVSVSGNSRSVLSRVAFYGADYSQRSNRLAAHVLVEPSEQSPGGPAWMMMHANVLRGDWSGEPQHLSAGPRLPKGDRAPRPCAAWGRAMGDAGWGGVLAESFISAPSKPAYVIYTPGTDVLALFEEALSLLPPEKRWEVTFSTFFTELPLNLNCAWRGVAAGTKAAREAVAMGPRALVLNLTNPPTTAAPDSPYANAARAGSGPVAPRAFAASAPGTAAASAVKATPAKPGNLDDTKVALKVEEELVAASLARGRGDRGKRLGGKPEDFDLKDEPVDLNSLTLGTPPSYKPSPPSKRRGMPWWAVTSIVAACLVIGGIAGYLVYTTNLHAPAQVATTQPAGEASTPLPTTNVSPTARPVDEREIARAASDGDKHRNPDKPPSQPNAKPSDTARNGKGNDGQTQQGTPATKPEAPDKKGFATPANLIAQKSPSQPTINPSPTEPTPAATAAQPLKMVALDDSSIINDGKDPPLVLRITEAPPTTCDKDGRWTPGGNNLPPLENVQTLSMAWKDNSTQCNVDGKSLTTIQLRVRGNGRTMELYTAANDSKDDTSPKTILRVVFDGKVLNYYWKDKDQGSKYVIPQVSTCVFVLKDAQKHTVAKVRFGDAVREVTLNQDAAAPANPLPIPSGITLKDLVLTDNLEDTRWKHDGGKSAASNAALTSAYQTTGKSVAFSTGTSEKLFDGRGVPSANTGGTPVQGYSERPTFKVTAAIAEKGEKEKQQVLELSWDWPNIDRKKKKEQYETDLKCTKLEDMEKYNVNPNDQSSRTIVGQMVALGKVNASNLKTKKQIEEDVKRASRPLNEREQKFMDGIKPEHDKLQTQFDDLRKQLKAEQKDFLTRWWIKPFDITVRLKNGLDLAVVHVKLDDSWNPERSVAP